MSCQNPAVLENVGSPPRLVVWRPRVMSEAATVFLLTLMLAVCMVPVVLWQWGEDGVASVTEVKVLESGKSLVKYEFTDMSNEVHRAEFELSTWSEWSFNEHDEVPVKYMASFPQFHMLERMTVGLAILGGVVAILLLGIVAFACHSDYKRGIRIRSLLTYGVAVEGKVVEKIRRGKSWGIRFEFTPEDSEDSQPVVGYCGIPDSAFRLVENGSAITVFYSPEMSSNNCAYFTEFFEIVPQRLSNE
ncbi:MAG: hypothetical protein R3C18_19505 [Planctomycetaceae bacterium]